MMSYTSRVVLLIDMDCFYCQVEENLDAALKGKPIAVVQYNQWRGGGIIAVNYPARDKGVTRHMRGNIARKICPEIILASVPEVRGKADLTKYRDAGKRVADVLQTFTPHLERASVDEAYLDITEVVESRINDKTCNIVLEKMPNTFVLGSSTADFVDNVTGSREYNESNFKLAVGGIVAEEIRAEVYKITGYKCSAGIAHNKILAKLVCGLNKPDKQTILPHEAVSELYETLPIGKIKSLGGKFGNAIAEKLGIKHMGELLKFGQKELARIFDEKTACWLYNIARGIDMEPVTTRLISKSIGCCKKFPGKSALLTWNDVEHWLNELAEEISERLEKDLEENNRRPKQMVVSFAQGINGEEVSSTRTHPLNSYEQSKIFENGLKVIQKNCLKPDGSYIITFLGISVGNFHEIKKVKEITSFFKNMRDTKKEKYNIKHIDPKNSLRDCSDTCNEVNPSESTLLELQSSLNNIAHAGGAPKTAVNSPNSDSIYSNTTEENDSGCNDYIYYEQINQNAVTDQSFIDNNIDYRENDNSSNTSEDSISREFNFQSTNLKAKESNISPPNSFFTKYFDDNSSRNFNTSKILENAEHSDLDTTGEGEEGTKAVEVDYSVCDGRTYDMSNKQSINVENLNVDDTFETKSTCPECGKTISYLDYQSHMDYHFAINMVKQEAHLYKAEYKKRVPTSPSSSKTTKSNEKQKRKENDGVKSKPIAQFFKNNMKQMEEGNSQSCLDCHKRIRLDDWEIHRDFHAAKKLHLEMNVNKNNSTTAVNSTKSKGQKDIKRFLTRS